MIFQGRGWTAGLAAISTVIAALLVLSRTSEDPPPREVVVIGFGIIAAYIVIWFPLARRVRAEGFVRLLLIAVTVVCAGALTAVLPWLAMFQGFAYPLIWTASPRTREAIVGSTVLAGAVFLGFLVSIGTDAEDVLEAATIQTISFGFNLVIGLWISRISQLSDDRQALVDELTAAQDQLASLHRDAGATGERERLARELHDTVAQNLTGLVMLGQRARRELAGGDLGDSTLELIETGARATLADTRALVMAGARVELDGGIGAAIERLIERFERETSIDVEFTSSVGMQLEREDAVVVLRVVQEGLANVRKHSRARTSRVELVVDAVQARVSVSDDGDGFDPARARTGFGLSGLRDRLALVGGELSVSGAAGAAGVSARIPLAGKLG